MYFTNHVLKELSNYDPQGDFSNINPIFGINIDSLTRDYYLVREHNLWEIFRRFKLTYNHDYIEFILYRNGRLDIYRRFSLAFKNYYTYAGQGFHITNVPDFRKNMRTIEYIANNGWFKYIMN